jgi:hypothetical protein
MKGDSSILIVFVLGLNNCMLAKYAPFNRETVIAMQAFLSDFQKPFCFVGKMCYVSNENIVLFFSS